MKKQGKVQRGADSLNNELKLYQIFISRFYFKLHRHFSMIGVISLALCIALVSFSSFQPSDEIFRLTIAKASKLNSRNSESDIIKLKNGDLLLF